MEVGRLAHIEQAETNNSRKIEKVQNVDKKYEIVDEEQYKKSAKDGMDNYNEVLLENVKFGYDKDSKSFFIKVKKGDVEITTPTEEILNLRSYLLKLVQEKENKNNKV